MTKFNFNLKIDPKTLQAMAETVQKINAGLNLSPETVQKITDNFANISAGLVCHQPAFKRQIAGLIEAREADRIVAEIKSIGGYDQGQVGDIYTAIRFSQFGSSSTATAEYIKAQVLAGVELQAVLDDVMGN